MIQRAVIDRLHFPIDGYLYNVRIETSIDNNLFAYCGNGRYFKTKAEAEAYKKEFEER